MWTKSFTQRVVGAWGMLSGMFVKADTIVAFKKLIDRHLDLGKGGI